MKTTVQKHRDMTKRFSQKKLALAFSSAMLIVPSEVLAQYEIEEVIITAQKREQSIIDVPYNISAVSGESIKNAGATSLEDLARLVPGMAMANAGQKQALNNNMILRGVNVQSPSFNNSFQNIADAPVSMYFGEVPLFAGIKMADIQRVEVLRGPQGTLYGSGSVGGTVRFIFNKPDVEEKVADISGRLSANEHSEELNYSTDFVGNLPVSAKFAVRVAGGYEEQGGVTDALGLYALDPSTRDPAAPFLADPTDSDSGPIIQPKKDTDDFDTWYLRASALWNISDEVEAGLTLFRQENEGDGDTVRTINNNDVDSGPEWAHHMRRLTDDLAFTTDVYSLELIADLGFATLTSATGFTDVDKEYQNDLSGLYQFLDDLVPGGLYFGFPRLTAPSPQEESIKTLTEELRITTNTKGRWDRVAGLFYKDVDAEISGFDLWPGYFEWVRDASTMASTSAGTGMPPTVFNTLALTGRPDLEFPFTLSRQIDFEEVALFGELTFRITEEWQVTGGLRAFWQDFEQDLFNQLPICGVGCSADGVSLDGIAADNTTKEDFSDQIFKLNTSYKIADEHRVYFTWAEGFRHGGVNGFASVGVGAVPPEFITFDSDEATNYEIGLKGELLDGRVRYSTAIYRIDWDNPQTDAFLGFFALPGVVNAEESRSEGVELELTAQWTEHLLMTFGYNYIDAEFTEDATTLAPLGTNLAGIEDGDAMPGVPEHMAALSLDYFFPLDSGAEIHANVNGNYRSSVVSFANRTFGDFAKLNGFSIWNASLAWNKGKVTVGAFVNNIGDEEGVTGARIRRPDAFDDRAFIGRPRHYGLLASYSFF